MLKLWAAASPTAPNRNTVAVWITVYRDSKPMIDGVITRLFVTVWNATVAAPWQSATTAMAMTELARRSAMSQNWSVPKGIGLL